MRVVLAKDPKLALISFFQEIPGVPYERFETVRLSTSQNHVKAMIDVFSKILEYYPERPKEGHNK